METKNKSLENKKIIVLGGSSGIGLATAKASADEGAQVIIVSSNQIRINEALKQLPINCKGYAVDLGIEQNIKSFFDQVGMFDHLVYTAGENINLGNINETDIDFARNYFNLRYWGAFASVKYGSAYINHGGSINLTGGIASVRPSKGWSLGASICSAMEGFTRAMAVELAPIRVNLVSPGVVKTNLWNGIPATDRESMYETIGSSLPVKRVGSAEDIAQTYLYLMKQNYGTGQIITVDGGAVLV
jgi:NAD(P)-dependent dehydrogenase (short-subunit alcohol dehydrogenase family)